jgi:hypothetical protein
MESPETLTTLCAQDTRPKKIKETTNTQTNKQTKTNKQKTKMMSNMNVTKH